ncbi:uncharacterized protein KQ657_001587 [Scheffersomyces spartinae]|uniref:Dystroglycan-type cadherin-like domain-containing protein n=1 Tax=Scheffersomyces spartinae TaxID=45513 RepID=A0A9P8AHG7_9ASCO|nr:uncharacterized protein KQ657_001587 [Scheffersomyces spartinae]KAG7192492.1 hypothetical protein KQ657_001587 [Scheffersomyces spartinae]
MANGAAASVYVGFPFSEQLPNVARVDQSYSFTMANVTYKSTLDDGIISYQVLNGPSWLQFDSGSRTFLGTPTNLDLGSFDITLTGFDSQNNSLANNYTMIVSDLPGIKLTSEDIMFSQIAQYGKTNGQNGLVVQQGQQVNIAFDPSIFKDVSSTNNDGVVAYYGRSADRSSLPNWLKYNSNALSFVGTVPYVVSDIAPSTSYNFAFIASDIKGYAAAVGYFELIVGFHTLSTSQNETEKINGTLNMEIDYTVPVLEQVYIDNNLVVKENISQVAINDLPSYATFNESDYSLSGTFPNLSTVNNFTVVVKDVYGNSVELPYQLEAMSSLFTLTTLPDLNATKGEFFSHQLLKSYFTDFNSTTITVDTNNQSWLQYHSSNLTLNGNVPNDFDSADISIVAASSSDNKSEEEKSFKIKGVSKTTSTTTSSSTSSTSSSKPSSTSSSSYSSGTSVGKQKKKSNLGLIIGLAVGIPVFILLVALALILLCCIRRKQQKTDTQDVEKLPPMSVLPDDKSKHMRDQAEQLDALKQLELHKSGLTPIIGAMPKKVDDINSVSSSLTHVDSHDQYYDTSDKPLMSWRANDDEDSKSITKDESVLVANSNNNYRQSDASMSTVNTERLFSVRLIDDLSVRDSQRSLVSGGGISRNSSGNFQRLDSDGNIAQGTRGGSYLDIVDEVTEEINTTGESTLPNGEVSHFNTSTPPILDDENDILLRPNVEIFNAEEPNNSREQSSVYHSLREDSNQTLDSSSSYNLLGKLNDLPQDERNINNDDDILREADDETSGTPSPRGNQLQSDVINTFPFHSSIDNISGIPMISPMSETSTLGKSPHSLGGDSSSKYVGFKLNGSDHGLPLDSNDNPKLVAFTRKASLRDSSYEPDHAIIAQGESAVIHNSDSD